MDKAQLDASAQASINSLRAASAAVKARNAKARVAPSSSPVRSAVQAKAGVTGGGAKDALIEKHLAGLPPEKRDAVRALWAKKQAGERISVDDLLSEGLVDENKAEELRAKVSRVDDKPAAPKRLPPPAITPELRAELAAIKEALTELRTAVMESDARSVQALETANSVSRSGLELAQQMGELLTAVAVSTQMQREIMGTLSKFEASGLLAAADPSKDDDDAAAHNNPEHSENGVAHNDGE